MTTGNRGSLSWPCLVLLVLLLAAAGRLAAAEPGQQPASSAPAMGQLKIEGGAVEQLTLEKNGREQRV